MPPTCQSAATAATAATTAKQPPAAAFAQSATRFSLNTSGAKSSSAILSIIASEQGWDEVAEPTSKRGSVFWVVSPDDLEARLVSRRGDQRLSHIPGMHALCRKVAFARLAHGHGFGFFPATWILPPGELTAESRATMGALLRSEPLILKPDDGTQGEGIFILRSLPDLARRLATARESLVVQRYIDRPLLLEGRLKFDVRLYALILSLEPRRLLLCRDGLVRCCSEAYASAKAGGGTRVAAHLTNYSINKSEPGFAHNSDPTDGERGTKRSLVPVLEALGSRGVLRPREAWAKMRAVVHATLEAMASTLDESVVSRIDLPPLPAAPCPPHPTPTPPRPPRPPVRRAPTLPWHDPTRAGGLAPATLPRALPSRFPSVASFPTRLPFPHVPSQVVDGLEGAELWTPAKTSSALWSRITTAWGDEAWGEWRPHCFHLLGVDVMLDADGTAHLLEVRRGSRVAG